MSRVDVPTLQCDRCAARTTNQTEMSRFMRLTHYHMGGQKEWDLCVSCREAFNAFMKELK